MLSCSKAKREGAGAMPARELYDGPAFRVLRASGADNLRVWVLSAKHGIIPANKRISYYDLQMTAARADELRGQVASEFDALPHKRISEWLICAGKNYMRALSGCEHLSQDAIAKGTIGRQISILKQWLESRPVAPPCVIGGDMPADKHNIQIGGRRICVSARDATDIAASGRDCPAADNFQTWYVQTPHGKVAAKWLVAELAGIPVSRFRTADALRVLDILGLGYNRKSLQEDCEND